jgi:hypothetical protein
MYRTLLTAMQADWGAGLLNCRLCPDAGFRDWEGFTHRFR